MTAARACREPWLAPEAPELPNIVEYTEVEAEDDLTPRVRSPSRASTITSVTITERHEPLRRGTKRKTTGIDEVSGSLSSLSLSETLRQCTKRRKREEPERTVAPRTIPFTPFNMPTFGSDEVPGLTLTKSTKGE